MLLYLEPLSRVERRPIVPDQRLVVVKGAEQVPGTPHVLLVEVAAQARGVGDQVTNRDAVRHGRRQPGLVEVLADLVVEGELPGLDETRHRGRGEHLVHRTQVEFRVEVDADVIALVGFPCEVRQEHRRPLGDEHGSGEPVLLVQTGQHGPDLHERIRLSRRRPDAGRGASGAHPEGRDWTGRTLAETEGDRRPAVQKAVLDDDNRRAGPFGRVRADGVEVDAAGVPGESEDRRDVVVEGDRLLELPRALVAHEPFDAVHAARVHRLDERPDARAPGPLGRAVESRKTGVAGCLATRRGATGARMNSSVNAHAMICRHISSLLPRARG